MNILTLTQMRTNLPSLVAKVADKLERFVVTVSGKPRAVLVSADELASLEETAEVMSTVDLVSLRRGITQAKKKQGMALNDL